MPNCGILGLTGGKAPGNTIIAGSPTEYQDAASSNQFAVALDANTAIGFSEESNLVYATMLTVSGLTVTAGVTYPVTNVNPASLSYCKLSSSKALVAFIGVSSYIYVSAVVVTDDGEIIGGLPYTVHDSAGAAEIGISRITDSTALIAYNIGSTDGYVRVLSISGGTVSAVNAAYKFTTSRALYLSVGIYSSTRAVVCFEDVDNSSYGKAQCITMSGTDTPSSVAAVSFSESETSNISVVTLSETSAIVVYEDEGDSSKGKACLLSLSGTTITPGTPIVFNNAATGITSITKLSSARAIVAYVDTGDSNKGKACVITLSDGAITASAEFTFDLDTVGSLVGVSTLFPTKAIVGYGAVTDVNYYGDACVLSIN